MLVDPQTLRPGPVAAEILVGRPGSSSSCRRRKLEIVTAPAATVGEAIAELDRRAPRLAGARGRDARA